MLRTHAAAALTAALLLAGAAGAQTPSSKVIGARLPNGGYTVVIGTDTMVALPDSILRALVKMQGDLRSARTQIEDLQKIADARQQQLAGSDTLLARQKAIGAVQDSQITSLKKEVSILEALRNRGWLSVELGAGVNGSGTPGILAGVAVRRLRVWGLAQKGNTGGFLGLGFPIF